MNNIQDLRGQIDEIDNKIMELLDKRFSVAKEIAIYKKENKLPIIDENREKEIIDKTKLKENSSEISDVYKELLLISKAIMKK